MAVSFWKMEAPWNFTFVRQIHFGQIWWPTKMIQISLPDKCDFQSLNWHPLYRVPRVNSLSNVFLLTRAIWKGHTSFTVLVYYKLAPWLYDWLMWRIKSNPTCIEVKIVLSGYCWLLHSRRFQEDSNDINVVHWKS